MNDSEIRSVLDEDSEVDEDQLKLVELGITAGKPLLNSQINSITV